MKIFIIEVINTNGFLVAFLAFGGGGETSFVNFDGFAGDVWSLGEKERSL